jgi:hypothetical protein
VLGTLIGARAVLTAAHCLEAHPRRLEVISGAALDPPGEVLAVWAVVHPVRPAGRARGPARRRRAGAGVGAGGGAGDVGRDPAPSWWWAPLVAAGYGAISASPGAPSGRRLVADASVDELTAAIWTTGGTPGGGDSGGAMFIDTAMASA